MRSSLTCSVIIPTYNRMRLLGYTLESLTRQSIPREEFEVIVVDDGSSDMTESVVDSYRDRLDLHYFFQEDKGFRVAKARNTGIASARAEVCVFIDSGVVPHSDCLAAHVAAHESSGGPVAVCGYVYCFNLDNEDAELINKSVDFSEPDAAIASLREKRQWLDVREAFYTKYSDDIQRLPAPWLMFWACDASARTRQLRSVGMFDEAFQRWGAEDVDLGYRLHADGARIVLNRQAEALHCPHVKSFGSNLESVARNLSYLGRKYQTPITMLFVENPEIDFLVVNDVIAERGLPTCAEYRAMTHPRAGGNGALS